MEVTKVREVNTKHIQDIVVKMFLYSFEAILWKQVFPFRDKSPDNNVPGGKYITHYVK